MVVPMARPLDASLSNGVDIGLIDELSLQLCCSFLAAVLDKGLGRISAWAAVIWW
jgi:hypothetical protein